MEAVPRLLEGSVRSVNIGHLAPNPAKGNLTAIGKRPVAGPVWVSAPGVAKGKSGLAGDAIGDGRHHGGDDQAVYVFAREDLDAWEAQLGRDLPDGCFGENLTTVGLRPDRALLGEIWRVGDGLLLQVTGPRIPCKTFVSRMGVRGWARRFTESGRPGAYLRVLEPGLVQAGDAICVVERPGHDVDVATALSAFTTRPELLPRLLAAGGSLSAQGRAEVEKALAKRGTSAALAAPP